MIRLTLVGGIHLPNLPQLLHASISPLNNHALDGVAVISDIVGSTTPKQAAESLRKVVDSFKRVRQAKGHIRALYKSQRDVVGAADRTAQGLVRGAGELMRVVRKETPMIHQVSLKSRAIASYRSASWSS